MKKFLSLVLALVMTMSLVTVSAGAKDYTDGDKVNYKEAIDVMSTIGVISGYEDGSINPQGALTRGAAAKIICNLVLGPTDAAALAVTEAPYKDVPANSTFAGYIAYCKSAGYVSGYADGTFKPGATLTGYAFMKMLLGTLGLDSAIEEYVGNNWSVNVAKRALKLGLDDGLVGAFNGTKGVNREEAMLFAFNTLQERKFTYADKGSNITVGGVTINTGASEAVQNGAKLYVDLFGTKLIPADTTDDFGRPATKWTYKGKAIGTYVDEADLTYAKEVSYKTIYADLGLAESTSFNYYLNTSAAATGKLITKNDDSTKLGKDGVILEIFKDSDNVVNNIVRIDPYFAKVTEVAEDDDGRFVLTAAGDKMYTEEFAKNDYIVYTKSDVDTEIQTAYPVEKQTGTVTKKVGTNVYYIDGEKYTTSASSFITVGTASVKDKVDFYVDANGYIVKIAATSSTATIDNVAVYTDGGKDRGQDWVKALFVGEKKAKIVDTKDNWDVSGSYTNKLVKYELDGDVYKMETVGHYYAGSYSYTSGAATMNINGDALKLDGKTTFMLINSDGEATYYTGIKNAPTFSTATGVSVLWTDNDQAKAASLVVVIGATSAANSNDLTFIIKKPDTKKVDAGDGNLYYTYKTLKGETMDVTYASANTIDGTSAYDNGIAVVKSYTTNSKGVATVSLATANVDYYKSSIVSEVVNGVVTVGTHTLSVTDDCAVYRVSKDTKTVVTSDLESIVEESGAGLYYNEITAILNKDGEVDTIILSSKN